MPSVLAEVEPELLSWARDTGGFTLDEAAKKLGISEDRLTKWENGTVKPTVKQLRTLARVYRRPIAVFFFATPPEEPNPPRDFRRLPGTVAGVESPDLRFEIRRATFRRDIALELIEVTGDEPQAFPFMSELPDSPENLAGVIRGALDVSTSQQAEWRDQYEAFNGWRGAVERAGALVLQMTDVDVSEARAFSIGERPLPAVVLNIKDPPRARIFSLLHEVAHIVLQISGLCDLDDIASRGRDELRIERFCNATAGAALLPRDAVLAAPTVVEHGASEVWSDDELDDLSRRFAASREAVLRRLLDLDRTTQEFYSTRRARFLEEYEEMRRGRTGGFAPPASMAVASAGPALTSLVLDSYADGTITASDVSEYLGVRLKHLPRIADQVSGLRRIS
jgi:Zn-dependent peptidase ImmA (M78 family)/DNA-binding XRE family transcriptional regulator